MSFFDNILLEVLFLTFPILCYFIVLICNANIRNNKKMYLLDIANLTSIFLIIHYSNILTNYYLILLINIPLLISFFYKRKVSSFIISILIIFYYYNYYHLSIIISSIEYFIYYIIFIFIVDKNKIINIFTVIKSLIVPFIITSIFKSINTLDIFIKMFLIIVIFYTISNIIIRLVYETKEAIVFHSLIKSLEKEKTLKNALFQITHEVKNPLAVCKGYLSMINLDNIDKTSNYLEIINNEVNRTLNMLDDFNDYNKIKVDLNEIDLHMLLDEVINTFEDIKDVYSLKINKNIKDDEIYIMGDYNRLKQVFVNIIKNAIEASDGKSKELDISLYTKKDKVIIKVRDYGCGMDKETLNKIGKLFYTTKEKGTGLGVSIAKEILDGHNAKIKYYSKLNKGTTVTVCFNMI